MKVFQFSMALLIWATASFAQPAGEVTGAVVDQQTRQALVGANVEVLATNRGSATDRDGRFIIKNVPPGDYDVRITAMGYAPLTVRVRLASGERVQLRLELKPVVIRAPEITVTESGFRPAEPFNRKVVSPADPRPSVSAELVSEIPGVSIARVGSWGSKPVIRGYRDEQVVVFVDGVRINRAGPARMDAALATVPSEQVERIEVLRGPQAAIYGPGSIGGMINVVTTGNSDFSTERLILRGGARLSGASAAEKASGAVNLSLASARLVGNFRAGGLSQGDYRTPEGDVPNTGLNESFYGADGRVSLTQRQRIGLNLQQYRLRNAGYPGLAAEVPADDRDTYAVRYIIEDLSPHLGRIQASANYMRMFHHMIVNAVDNPMMKVDADVAATSKTYSANLRASLFVSRRWSSLVGIDFYRWDAGAERHRIITRKMMGATERTGAETIWPDVQLHDIGVFSQHTLAAGGRLTLETGLRLDRIAASGDIPENSMITSAPDLETYFVGGDAAARYRFGPGLQASLALGRAFRAPDPSELYISLPLPVATGMPPLAYFVGNPKLALERSRQLEIGLGGESQRVEWNASLFLNQVEDMIVAVTTGDSLMNLPVRQYRNLPRAVVRGGEVSVEWEVTSRLAIRGSASYVWGETRSSAGNIPSGAPLPEMPPLELSSHLRYKTARWLTAELSGRVVASQNRVARYTREGETKGFHLLNLRTWLELGRNITLVAGVRNLLDGAYSEHLNQIGRRRSVAIQQGLDRILEPGRDFYVSLDLRF